MNKYTVNCSCIETTFGWGQKGASLKLDIQAANFASAEQKALLAIPLNWEIVSITREGE